MADSNIVRNVLGMKVIKGEESRGPNSPVVFQRDEVKVLSAQVELVKKEEIIRLRSRQKAYLMVRLFGQ